MDALIHQTRCGHLAVSLPQILLLLPLLPAAPTSAPPAGCAESRGANARRRGRVRVVLEPVPHCRLPIAAVGLPRRIGAIELLPPLAVVPIDHDRLRVFGRRVDRAQPQAERRNAALDHPGDVERSAPVLPAPAGVETEREQGRARRIHLPLLRRIARAVLAAHRRQPHVPALAVDERTARNRRPAAGFDLNFLPFLAVVPPFHDVPIDRNAVLGLVPRHDQVLALVSSRSDAGRKRLGRRTHRLRPFHCPAFVVDPPRPELVPALREAEDVQRAVVEHPADAAAVNVPLELDHVADAGLLLYLERGAGPRTAMPVHVPNAELRRRIRRHGLLPLRRRDRNAELPARRRAVTTRPRDQVVDGARRESDDQLRIFVPPEIVMRDCLVLALLADHVAVTLVQRATVGMPAQHDPIRPRRSLQHRREFGRVGRGLRRNQQADRRIPLPVRRGVAADCGEVPRAGAQIVPAHSVRRLRLDRVSARLVAVAESDRRRLPFARREGVQCCDVVQAFDLRAPAQGDRVVGRFRDEADGVRRRGQRRDLGPGQRLRVLDLPRMPHSRDLRFEDHGIGQLDVSAHPAVGPAEIVPRPVGDAVDVVAPLRLARHAPAHRNAPQRNAPGGVVDPRDPEPERHVEAAVRYLRRVHLGRRERRAGQQGELRLRSRAVGVDGRSAHYPRRVTEHPAAPASRRDSAGDPRCAARALARRLPDLHLVRRATAAYRPIDFGFRSGGA